MMSSVWIRCFYPIATGTHDRLVRALRRAGIVIGQNGEDAARFGLAVLAGVDAAILAQLRALCTHSAVLVICVGERGLPASDMWAVLAAGASDVLCWPGVAAGLDRDADADADVDVDVAQVAARLARWDAVRRLVESETMGGALVGASDAWRTLVRAVVEIAAFSSAPVLITGETGTGKELIAQLIGRLDPGGGRFTVLDCTTLSPELAGSELFGHERGAFTGAANARDGAFALADGGVLFLDEVGELPLPLQAQLLRAIQEHTYKRIGSNSWQRTTFRLLCATNRELEDEVAQGRFRADLLYRIAGWRCRTPPLRERREDIVPLVRHFLAQLAPPGAPVELDPAVRDYFLARDYPGNVRELRQAVTRVWHRHAGPGPITIGAVPPDERPEAAALPASWPGPSFEIAIGHAIEHGIPLARISQMAGDLAIQLVLEQEHDNNQRAAARLGVTDRALQIRRKAWARPPR
jgi:transcriptional regulator with GAF, ATPase, and Fis domain